MADDEFGFDKMFGEGGRISLEGDILPADAGQTAQTAETPVVEPDAKVEAPVLDDEGKPMGHNVPLALYLDTRERANAATARLAELEAAEAERTRAASTADIEIPDATADPEGHRRFQQTVTNLTILNDRMNMSEKMARLEYKAEDPELVDKAKAWAIARFPTNAAYEDTIMSHQDPFAQVISDYRAAQRAEKLSKAPDDFDADDYQRYLEAREKGEPYVPPKKEPAVAEAAAAAPQPKTDPNPAPIRSIASATSAGGQPGAVAVGDGKAFDGVFK